MTNKERRQYRRKTLNPLPYINLPSGNGGIVLDVSEQGLQFRSLAPVDLSGPFEFSFTAHSSLVTGTGELVWMDEARKLCGLRFTDLPYFVLEKIRKLPSNENLRPVFAEDLSMHIPALDESQQWRASQRRPAAAIGARISSLLSTGQREAKSLIARIGALPPATYLQNNRRRVLQATAGALVGILILSVGIMRRHETGAMLAGIGAKFSRNATVTAPAPSAIPQTPRADDSIVEQAKAAEPSIQPQPQPLPVIAAAPLAAPAKELAAPVPAPVPAPAVKESLARPAMPEIRRGDLVVQVAALKQESDARELSNKLHEQKFQAFVGTLPGDSFYRVMMGPYTDSASALSMRNKLKKAGFSSFIRRETGEERVGSLGKSAPRQEPAT